MTEHFSYLDLLFDENINVQKSMDLDNARFIIPGTNRKNLYSKCTRVKNDSGNIYYLKCFSYNLIDHDGNDIVYYINPEIIILKMVITRQALLFIFEISIPHDILFVIKNIHKYLRGRKIDLIQITQLCLQDINEFKKIIGFDELLVENNSIEEITSALEYSNLERKFVSKIISKFSLLDTKNEIISQTIDYEIITQELREMILQKKQLEEELKKITIQFSRLKEDFTAFYIENLS